MLICYPDIYIQTTNVTFWFLIFLKLCCFWMLFLNLKHLWSIHTPSYPFIPQSDTIWLDPLRGESWVPPAPNEKRDDIWTWDDYCVLFFSSGDTMLYIFIYTYRRNNSQLHGATGSYTLARHPETLENHVETVAASCGSWRSHGLRREVLEELFHTTDNPKIKTFRSMIIRAEPK